MKKFDSIKLTDNQKRIIAKIIAAPTPKVAAEEISGDVNLTAAKTMLLDLGVIQIVDNHATLTDAGQLLAKDENLADESGQLTPDGEEFAYTDSSGDPNSDTPQQQGPVSDVTGNPDSYPLTMSQTFDMYNMRLLKELLTLK